MEVYVGGEGSSIIPKSSRHSAIIMLSSLSILAPPNAPPNTNNLASLGTLGLLRTSQNASSVGVLIVLKVIMKLNF